MGLIDKIRNGKKIFPEKIFFVLESDIDKLYKNVIISKRIRIDAVAEKIGLSIERVEELAKILEKKGMVGLHYPFIGKPIIFVKIK